MRTHDALQATGAARRGAWQLDRQRVVRLIPREARYLRACSGQLWVTLASPPGTPAGPAADHILDAGERLLVRAGQTAVVSVTGPRGAIASFDWERGAAPQRADWRLPVLPFFGLLGWAPRPAR